MSTFSRAVLIIALLIAASIARSDGIYNPGGRGVGFTDGVNNGGAAVAPPPLTNLRITNTGDFRITNTGDNRAVFP